MILKNADLPSNFALAQYASCAEFGLNEWREHIVFRTVRRRMHRDGDTTFNEDIDFINDHLDAPLVGWIEEEIHGYRKLVGRTQVRDETVREALHTAHFLSSASGLNSSLANRLNREIEGGSAPGDVDLLGMSSWRLYKELGIEMANDVTVIVDLHAPEKKVLEDFQSWFRKTRKALGLNEIKKRYTQVDFKRWGRFKVLAYFDLTFWAEVNKVEISNEVIGTALFPDEFNVNLAERVRKVIEPLANVLFAEQTIDALTAQVQEERNRKAL